MSAYEHKGREALRNETLCKAEGNQFELEHLRFRDVDLTSNGGAMLGFSGLMLASDLVFLSANPQSFIAPREAYAWLGFLALLVLAGGSYFATSSIVERVNIRDQSFDTPFEYFGAVETYHDKRRAWLAWSRRLTFLGTLMFLSSVVLSSFCRFLG